MTKTYWTMEFDGEIFDMEDETYQEAKEYADGWYSERFLGEDMKNGEERHDECEIVEYFYDDEGKKVETSRHTLPLYYEHYHGDIKEHGTRG